MKVQNGGVWNCLRLINKTRGFTYLLTKTMKERYTQIKIKIEIEVNKSVLRKT